MSTTYALAKGITASAMALTPVPVYLWARRLVTPIHALLAAALTLLLPALFYSGVLMTEGAFLPAFVLAVFAIAVALERPTLLHQLAALAAIVLAVSIRVQGIVLFLVVPTAVLGKAVLDLRAGESRDRLLAELRRLWPTAVLLAGGLVVYVAYKQIQSAPLATGLGEYQGLAQAHYPLVATARWALKHLAELVLAVGFVAVGAVAATVTPTVFERYTFYLEPLLITAFVIWLARGMPRPVVGTLIAVTAPVLLVRTLNFPAVVIADAINGITIDSLYKFSLS